MDVEENKQARDRENKNEAEEILEDKEYRHHEQQESKKKKMKRKESSVR